MSLKRSSLQMALKTYEEIHDLLNEQQGLLNDIRRTEWQVNLGGTPLAELEALLHCMEYRLGVLNDIESREDLSDEQLDVVLENAELFRTTKDNLKSQYERCLWEAEILDE